MKNFWFLALKKIISKGNLKKFNNFHFPCSIFWTKVFHTRKFQSLLHKLGQLLKPEGLRQKTRPSIRNFLAIVSLISKWKVALRYLNLSMPQCFPLWFADEFLQRQTVTSIKRRHFPRRRLRQNWRRTSVLPIEGGSWAKLSRLHIQPNKYQKTERRATTLHPSQCKAFECSDCLQSTISELLITLQ